MTAALLTGFSLGFLVAAQVGPIWLLAAQAVIGGRASIGIIIGLGAATCDMAYGGLGLLGAGTLLSSHPLRLGSGLLGAVVLAALGVRAVRRAARVAGDPAPPAETASLHRAYLVALGATAVNPMTFLSWMAVFAAARSTHLASGWPGAALLLAGIGSGTTGWFTVLSIAASLARKLTGPRTLRAISIVSGLGLIAFGVLLAVESARGT